MKSDYLKSQAAAVTGSIADYGLTILLVEFFHMQYLFANLIGNIIGGTVLFFLSRQWVFKADSGRMSFQILKFILVFMGNLFLSALGVYILTKWCGFNYLVSKTATSVFLGLTYNYIMQKKFVFSR